MMSQRFVDVIIGCFTPVMAAILSYQEQLEYWLRIASLISGIAVGIVYIYILLKDKK